MPMGANMNGRQARVVDPILSEGARGYSNAEYVGGALFPTVNMPTRGAKRIEFGREAYRRYNTRRAPGARIGRFGVGYEGVAVQLHQEALQAVTPIEYQEDANAVPGIDIQQESVNVVLDIIAKEKEIRQAGVARDPDNYADANKAVLAGNDQFDDPDSKPKMLIADMGEVIRARTGRRPNTLLLPGKVGTKLKTHPNVLEQFKYTRADSVTMADLAAYFDMAQVVSGDAIFDDGDGRSYDIWGLDVILAYVPPAAQRNMRVPSYGYTYQLRGHPFVEKVEWDKDARSWTNNVIDEFSPELVGADAGVLIKNAISG